MVLNTVESEVERLMREGQAAAKRGDKVMARALLTQLLEHDPHNEKAWMWLSGAVTELTEQQTCLENVLIINPGNAQARKGLEFIVNKTGVPSQVLLNLTDTARPVQQLADPATQAAPPTPASTPLMDPGFGGAQPFSPTTDTLPGAQAASTSAEPESPWSRESLEYTSPLSSADVTDHSALPTPDFSALSIPEPGSSGMTPWDQLAAGPGMTPYSGEMPEMPELPDFDTFAGGPPTPAPPLNLDSAMPDWVRAGAPGPAEGTDAGPGDLPEVQPFSPFEAQEAGQPAALPAMPAPSGLSSLPSGDADALEDGIDAWLGKFAAGSIAMPETDPSLKSSALNGEQHSSSNGPMDPFGMTFDSMGPYGATSLPSPDELPGSSPSGNSEPWYLAAAADQQHQQIEQPSYAANSGPIQQDANQAQSGPVTLVPCPNCREKVPDTSLACPNCRYNFFVHCPGCHELLDTTDARPGVTDSCEYSSVPVNRFELGQMYASELRAPSIPLSDPTESKFNWVGTGIKDPRRRSISLAWVVDVLWLLAIALMVWALTQLPAWFNLTGLYN